MITNIQQLFENLKKIEFNQEAFPEQASYLLNQLDKQCLIQIHQQYFEDKTSIKRIYDSENFFLNIHSWPNGITNCHCHEFSGAFRVITGKSIQLNWKFIEEKKLATFLSLGKLELIERKILDNQITEQIFEGEDKLIHQLIYLERPTATLVLRTKNNPNKSMDEYLYPGLKISMPKDLTQIYSRILKLANYNDIISFIDSQNLDIKLALYSGSLGNFTELMKNNYFKYKIYLEEILSKEPWFNDYKTHFEKHNRLIKKIMSLS